MNDTDPMAYPPEDFGGVKRKGTLAVIVGGVATSFLALAGVWLLGAMVEDFNIMGWYAMGILPAGAIFVGMVAGLGYSLVSWWRGVKITGLLLCSVLVLQVLVYAEAQFLEFRAIEPLNEDGTPMSFSTFYDLTTRSMTFSKRGGGGAGAPLGGWGYVFRALELVGFAVGGLIPAAALLSKPFCENCQVYMKTKSQGLLPAGIVPRKIKKADTTGQQAYEAELKASLENGFAQMEKALEHATQTDAQGFRALMTLHKAQQKEIQKQTARIEVQLNYCPQCHGGHLRTIMQAGQGEEMSQEDLRHHEVDPQFVRDCLANR